MAERLLLFGASGHGRVVADAARAAGWEIAGWADDDASRRGQELDGAPVVATGVAEAAAWARERGAHVVVSIGDNRARARLFEALLAAGADLATVVHPAAVVSPSATLGSGTVVFAGAVINPGTTIGRNVIVNTSVSVDHDNWIGDHAHLSPGVHLGGTVSVGEGAHLGVGVSVRNNLSIGAWTLVGVGAAVVADLPANVVAYGVPARVVRESGCELESRSSAPHLSS
jgi:sugar O-acyltransferase (sialic acid O-acetyltransferase NeuD family)